MAKKAVGDYLHAYRELHTIEFTALALADVYGPRQDPDGDSGVVATFARRLIAGDPCTITGDGSQTRDFVFVDDVVDAFVRAAEKGSGLLANIGTGVETSIAQLYETMAAAAGVDVAAGSAPSRPGEVHRSCVDPGKAGLYLGWKPWTTLDEGSRIVLDWFADQLPCLHRRALKDGAHDGAHGREAEPSDSGFRPGGFRPGGRRRRSGRSRGPRTRPSRRSSAARRRRPGTRPARVGCRRSR